MLSFKPFRRTSYYLANKTIETVISGLYEPGIDAYLCAGKYDLGDGRWHMRPNLVKRPIIESLTSRKDGL